MLRTFLRRAALGLALVLAAIVGSTAVASAADDVNSYTPITGVKRLPSPAELTDHSGVALTPAGNLLVVDNDEDLIVEYLQNGQGNWTRGRIFELGQKCEGEGEEQTCTSPISDPIDDLEDITWMGGDKYGLIDESDNALSVIRIPTVGTNVTELYSIDLWPWVPRVNDNGIEGLAYSFDESEPGTDTFYFVSESNSLLVRLSFNSASGAFKSKGPNVYLQIPTASAVFDVEGDDTFYIVSNEGRALYRFDKAGVQLDPTRSLDFIRPEGLTMSPDLTRLIVVGEAAGGNQIQEFAAPETSATTTTVARTRTSSDSAIENDGTVTTSGSLRFGDGAAEVTGLRFSDLCIPATASVSSARLSLFATGIDITPAQLTIRGTRGADAGPFIAGPGANVSNRPTTVRSLTTTGPAWTPPSPLYVTGLEQIIDELLGDPERGECDPVTLQITGTGLREAFSYELDPTRAPTLIVEWSEGTEPALLDVDVASSCLSERGRFDVTVSNPLVIAQDATVTVSGLPGRLITVPAGGEATSTITGRSNGRYLIEVRSNGAVNTNEVVVSSCAAAVTVEQQCLAGNGLFRVRMFNAAPRQARFTVDISGLSSRAVMIAPGESRMVGVSGRADGNYDIGVVRNVSGSPVDEDLFLETRTIRCDTAEEVEIVVNCFQLNGVVIVTVYNQTDAPAEYTVVFDTLPERTTVVDPGRVGKVSISGRPDGSHSLTVRRDRITLRKLSLFIRCDQIG